MESPKSGISGIEGSTPSPYPGLNRYPSFSSTDLFGNYTMDDAIYWENPDEMLIPWISNPYFFPIIITYVVTFIIGVSGNATVIWVMAGDRTSRSVTSIFLVSLAVSDLLLLTIYTPLEVSHYFVIQWDKEGTVCKLAAYAESVSAFASVLNLVAVTFERFVVIVFPIKSRSLCTMSNCKKALIFVWVLSIILAIPVISIKYIMETTFTNNIRRVTMFSCKELDDLKGFIISVYRMIILFVLPSILMISSYSWVIIELWVSTKSMDNTHIRRKSDENEGLHRTDSRTSISHEHPHSSPTSNRVILRSHTKKNAKDMKNARQQVIKMLILVVILFLCCWGPRLIMEIVTKCCLDVYNHGTYTLRIIFYMLPFIHSCLNPIVYCFMSSKFRGRILKCFKRNSPACCLSMDFYRSGQERDNLNDSRTRKSLDSVYYIDSKTSTLNKTKITNCVVPSRSEFSIQF